MIYLELLLGFLRVGCFTFGGGYAAIPLIRDVVLYYSWLTEDTLTYMIAVSESTPGPIMVNMATYVGSSQGGILGAAVATLAVVMPSFCVILLLMVVLRNLIQNVWVKAVLKGMQPCMVGVILATGITLSAQACFPAEGVSVSSVIIALILAGTAVVYQKVKKKKPSPIGLILFSGVLGILFYGI